MHFTFYFLFIYNFIVYEFQIIISFILKTNDKFKIDKFQNENFCLIFSNNEFKIYSNKKLNYKCLVVKN